jgi:peptide/nickel transport system substrate-binding protein
MEPLLKTNPELQQATYLGNPNKINMRNDTKPFNDVRVRQALMMAIDFPTIANDYYGGHAEILAFPAGPIPDYGDIFIPLKICFKQPFICFQQR